MPRRIADLSHQELVQRLKSPGILIDSGAVTSRLLSPLPEAADALIGAYGSFPLVSPDRLPDFRCIVRSARGLRRWFGRQAIPDFDRPSPFIPLPVRMVALAIESALNWSVAAKLHWLLVFHAAVVERGGQALILPGNTGRGKSTLCAALVAAGWRLLSDEFCLFDMETGRIHPNVRPISLKNDSIEMIRARGAMDDLTPAITGTPKGTIAYWPPSMDAIERRYETPRPLAMAFPFFDPGANADLVTMPKARAFMQVVASAINYEIHGETAFHAMASFIDQYPTYQMIYPDLDHAVALAARIEDEAEAA